MSFLTVTTISELRLALAAHRRAGRSIGLVPTMGALHEGHMSLVKASVETCDLTVATIFVNPTQFGPGEDFTRYPRTFEQDQALLDSAGCDLLFAPRHAELYPAGYNTWVIGHPVKSEEILCGRFRPGHFRGVLTIVAKLFNIVQPDVAYFGQKDFQQAWLIRRMVRDLDFPLRVEVCPTVREADGLALSSRNRYLSPDERESALVISRALAEARKSIEAGERDLGTIRGAVEALLYSEPGFVTQYVEFRDPNNLVEATSPLFGDLVIAIAGHVGKTRLIDNDILTVPAKATAIRTPEGAAHVS